MPIIQVDRVTKAFRTPRRQAGFLGSLRTLVTREYVVKHAVADISSIVEPDLEQVIRQMYETREVTA